MALNRQQFYAALFFLAPLLIFSLRPISTEDLSVWVALGRDALREGRLILTDPYSVLPTAPMVYPPGAPLLYGIAHGAGGFGLVVLLHRLCLLAVLFVVYRQSVGRLAHPWSGSTVLWAGFSVAGIAFGLVERPSVLAILPFVLALWILFSPGEFGLKRGGVLALLAIIWVNLHGSFVILPALLIWRILGKRLTRQEGALKPDFLTFLAVSAATLINPFGYRIYTYVGETALISRARMEEWQPSSFNAFFPQGLLFYWLVLILAALILRKRISFKAFVQSPLPPLLLLGASGIRHTDLCFYALLPFLFSVGLLQEAKGEGKAKRLNGIIVLAVALLCLASTPWWKPSFLLPPNLREIYSETAPYELLNHMVADPRPGAVFHHPDFGSFLTLAQGRKIFLDSRNIIFSNASLSLYRQIVNVEGGWDVLLDRYQVRFVLLKQAEGEPLRSALLRQGWRELGISRGAVLLGRGE